MKSRTIKVDNLARVEGEGALFVKIKDGKVLESRLSSFEPPRFFEAFLRGRDRCEAPDISARICGICPVAYQLSSAQALEKAAGIQVGGQIRALRRLLSCGEWIANHVMHIYMLHAPDFLGYPNAIAMARDHGSMIQKALRMKKIGNTLTTLIAGREIHPINIRLGGFYRAPAKGEIAALVSDLKWARDAAIETAAFCGALSFPDFTPDYTFVALHHGDEYAINEGRIVSSRDLDIDPAEYEAHFAETQVEHSTALQSTLQGVGAYLVGPLARFNLNYDQLTPVSREIATRAGLHRGCRNPFKSIIARAVETYLACDEALRIIAEYEPPEPAAAVIPAQAGIGQACTEAPRGTLYQRYNLDAAGLITEAKIVPPTAQNQLVIEADLRAFVETMPDATNDQLTVRCEQVVRNYDPCMSCATHFLNLEVHRK